jgi:hypothetical protein
VTVPEPSAIGITVLACGAKWAGNFVLPMVNALKVVVPRSTPPFNSRFFDSGQKENDVVE